MGRIKTLIIHPDDRSTDFLRPIYQNIKGATVLTKNISEDKLLKELKAHDQIIMLGHGTSAGLINMDQKMLDFTYVIGHRHAKMLKHKHCIFIWCNADKFVEYHNLNGIFTGMFISEVGEAKAYNIITDQKTIDLSNDTFATALGSVLSDDKPDYNMVFEHVKNSYGLLTEENLVANFNNQRWYYEPKTSYGVCL